VQPINLNRGASRPRLTVLQRFETIQALQVVIFLRSVLSLSFINDDLMFGSREDINRILLAVDATVAVGFSALAARRSLWRSLMYMHMDRHALTFENVTVGMCKESVYLSALHIGNHVVVEIRHEKSLLPALISSVSGIRTQSDPF
jgi:hypothetical protein